MKYKQNFKLDVTGVMNNPALLEDGDVQPLLREQLVEGYSPVLKRLEDFITKNEADTFSNAEKKEMLELIENQLQIILPKDKNVQTFLQENAITEGTNESNRNLAAHYAYLYNAINQDQDKESIVNNLSSRFTDQFIKDFPLRSNVRIIDQNGNEISPNMNQEVLKEMGIEGATDLTYKQKKEFADRFIKKVGISEAQWQYLQARYCQRSLRAFSASLSIVLEEGGIANIPGNEIQETWIVSEVDGNRQLHRLRAEDRVNNYSFEGADFQVVPYADIALEMDVSILIDQVPSKFPFPTQLVPEELEVKVFNEPSNKLYKISESLNIRKTEFSLIPKNLTEAELKKIVKQPDIEKSLSNNDLGILVTDCSYAQNKVPLTKNILSKFIKDKIDESKDSLAEETATKIVANLNIDDQKLVSKLVVIIDPSRESLMQQIANKIGGKSQDDKIKEFAKLVLSYERLQANLIASTAKEVVSSVPKAFSFKLPERSR